MRSLKAKLILSYLVILGAGGLITSLVGSWIVSTTIMTQAQRAAEHDLVAARAIYEHELAALRQAVVLVAPTIADRLGRGPADADAMAPALSAVRKEVDFDFLAVTDRAGRVVFRLGMPGVTGDTASSSPVVRAALAGRVAAASEAWTEAQLTREGAELPARARLPVVATPRSRPVRDSVLTGGLVLMVAAPVRDAAGQVQGALYGGHLLNRRYEMVDRVWELLYRGQRYQGEDVGTVTIFLGEVRIATTVTTDLGERAVGTQVSAPVADAVLTRQEGWRGRAFVVDDWYIAAYDPLLDIEGRAVGMLYVGLLERAYASIRNRVILSFFGLATAGFLIILGITYVMISNLTRPIGEMVAATREIAAGRLDPVVHATQQGELRLLAESFNTMLESLRQMKADLEDWGRTLEEKVQERTRQVMEMQVRVAQSERLASLGMLAAGVAHEVNNPLGGILALTALTLEDLDPDHPSRRNLEVVIQQTERCRDIVKGLLDFSRQSEVTVEALNVNAVLQDTLALVAQQSAFFNVQVVRNLSAHLPPVTGDRSQLQQVFLNILVNAVQAMDERGTITITTQATADQSAVEIRIADTGRGIPEADIDRIFDPFFTTREGGRGTGLGLAIAYGIVTRHHGHIDVQSTVGQGTAFRIRLPASPPGDSATG